MNSIKHLREKYIASPTQTLSENIEEKKNSKLRLWGQVYQDTKTYKKPPTNISHEYKWKHS